MEHLKIFNSIIGRGVFMNFQISSHRLLLDVTSIDMLVSSHVSSTSSVSQVSQRGQTCSGILRNYHIYC
jgi:hypothetical protein